MAKQNETQPTPGPTVVTNARPKVAIRYFRHKVTGEVHSADRNFARTMEGRADLEEVPPPTE